MTQWFRRFAEIAGVSYAARPGIDPNSLPDRQATPQVSSFEYDGRVHQNLMWRTSEGITSASPVQRHRTVIDAHGADSETILRSVYEGLELPGEASDYHFSIQGAVERLWDRRRDEPELLEEIETLAKLDLALIEAHPSVITFERDGERHYARVLAFGILVDLYGKNGLLHEALEIAEMALRFEQGEADHAALTDRLLVLESEDAP